MKTENSETKNAQRIVIDKITQSDTKGYYSDSHRKIRKSDYKIVPEGLESQKDSNDFENILYFVCNLCPYLCIKDSQITEHLERDHTNKKYVKLAELKCPACPNIFYHEKSLKSHLVYDHKVSTSSLQKIVQAVAYSSRKHIKEEEEEVTIVPPAEVQQVEEEEIARDEDFYFESDADHIEFYTKNDNDEYVEVKRGEHDMSPSPITILNQSMSTGIDVIGKLEVIETYKTKCTVPSCKLRLQSVKNMSYHLSCHKEANFECPECKETFAFWKPLAGHLWRVHKIDMELHSCDRCDYKCYSLGRLNNLHKLIHGEEKNVECDVCKKTFKNRRQMRNHRVSHRAKNERLSHTCHECDKLFSDRRQLRLHLDGVHKKLKPFLCNYCGYKGASRNALRTHIRQHTGEKPFTCDECTYTTSDHNSLRRHKFRHTGEKPYKCAYCDYACIQSSTYKVHLRTKHPGLEKDFVFTCSSCQFRSVSRDLYYVHMKTYHKNESTRE